MADETFESVAENAVLKTLRINPVDLGRFRRSGFNGRATEGLNCALVTKQTNSDDGELDLNSDSFISTEIECQSPAKDFRAFIEQLSTENKVWFKILRKKQRNL